MSKPRILLIGYGALARYVFNHLQSHSGPEVSAFLVSRRSSNDLPFDIEVVTHPDQLSFKPDIVLELASHQAVRDHAPYFLKKGVDFGIVSVGALAEEAVYKSITSLARQGESRLHILSGAIGGMDALSSARIGGLDEVLYRSRKPTSGWKGTPAESVINLEALEVATPHFVGSARDAALKYPKNANVAATVALSGIGLDRTRVELVADPLTSRNSHEVEARGAFGEFKFEIHGLPIPGNPKSSALTAMCAVRFLENQTGTLIL